MVFMYNEGGKPAVEDYFSVFFAQSWGGLMGYFH